MKKNLFLLLFFITLKSFSQITYEPGYIIFDDGKKINCYIKNYDWKNNPTKIKYKLSLASKEKTATIDEVSEFEINQQSKYIRATVNIDRSSEILSDLSTDRKPEFKKETLWLKVLLEGKASLYQYRDGNLIRYFYKVDNQPIEQLIYKLYISKKSNKELSYQDPSPNFVRKNERYKQQILDHLKCSKIHVNKVKNLGYTKNELLHIFKTYNECVNSEYKIYVKKNKSIYNVYIKTGINNSNLSVNNNGSSYKNVDLDNEMNLRIGMEAEYILPFNNNTWSIFIEPTYQKYESEKTIETSYVEGGLLVTYTDYKSIELPVGMRHYIFLNKKSKLFFDASLIYDFPMDSVIEFNRSDGSTIEDIEIKSKLNFALGVGYNYNDKLYVQFKVQTPRELLKNYNLWESDYNTMSVILAYKIL